MVIDPVDARIPGPGKAPAYQHFQFAVLRRVLVVPGRKMQHARVRASAGRGPTCKRAPVIRQRAMPDQRVEALGVAGVLGGHADWRLLEVVPTRDALPGQHAARDILCGRPLEKVLRVLGITGIARDLGSVASLAQASTNIRIAMVSLMSSGKQGDPGSRDSLQLEDSSF